MILGGKQSIEERINYYKLKNKKYGFEIVKEDSINSENIEIINITDNEEKIDNVLRTLVVKQITPGSSDIIEDLIKQYV